MTVGEVYQRALLIGWLYALLVTPFFLSVGRLLTWAGESTTSLTNLPINFSTGMGSPKEMSQQQDTVCCICSL